MGFWCGHEFDKLIQKNCQGFSWVKGLADDVSAQTSHSKFYCGPIQLLNWEILYGFWCDHEFDQELSRFLPLHNWPMTWVLKPTLNNSLWSSYNLWLNNFSMGSSFGNEMRITTSHRRIANVAPELHNWPMTWLLKLPLDNTLWSSYNLWPDNFNNDNNKLTQKNCKVNLNESFRTHQRFHLNLHYVIGIGFSHFEIGYTFIDALVRKSFLISYKGEGALFLFVSKLWI